MSTGSNVPTPPSSKSTTPVVAAITSATGLPGSQQIVTAGMTTQLPAGLVELTMEFLLVLCLYPDLVVLMLLVDYLLLRVEYLSLALLLELVCGLLLYQVCMHLVLDYSRA
ncbi:hypothetical protein PC120_g21985 [Phytophthora cactorum]|nr:hypothetical protein PC120_g21985 [Phytophthora cactorum]